jgi:hypothetical protein
MATERANDLQAFRNLIGEQLANGETVPTVDAVLARWEYENQTGAEREDTIQAIHGGARIGTPGGLSSLTRGLPKSKRIVVSASNELS